MQYLLCLVSMLASHPDLVVSQELCLRGSMAAFPKKFGKKGKNATIRSRPREQILKGSGGSDQEHGIEASRSPYRINGALWFRLGRARLSLCIPRHRVPTSRWLNIRGICSKRCCPSKSKCPRSSKWVFSRKRNLW